MDAAFPLSFSLSFNPTILSAAHFLFSFLILQFGSKTLFWKFSLRLNVFHASEGTTVPELQSDQG